MKKGIKDYVPKKVPDFAYGMQEGYFKREHAEMIDDAIKELGLKVFQKQESISDVIGDNPTICRNLFGLGSTLSRLVIDGEKPFDMFTEFSNHVWLPQVNVADPQKRVMNICLNCGSMMINRDFYSYLDVEAHEKEKESKKKEK